MWWISTGNRYSPLAEFPKDCANIFFASTEVFDEARQLVAYGASTHRYRSGSGDPNGVPEAAA